MRSLAVALLVTASCSGHNDDAPHRKPDSPVTFVPSDASASAIMPSGEGADTSPGTVAVPVPASPGSTRERRPIDVTLRSSPPGAVVAVDGTAVGVTPAFWGGYADGHEHEFVFTMPKYAIARYRFVPVTSGVIHARLDPIAEEHDAGVAPPPEVVPAQPPPVAPPPPVPLVTPADAAVGADAAVTGSGSSARGPQP